MNPEQTLQIALHGDPINAFPAIRELLELLQNAEHDHVMTLRRHGASWAFIGRHLHVSRSAIHQKFSHWDPRPTQT
jgi:hypothetical protein